MPWNNRKDKLIYNFPSYKGWNPSQTVIRGEEDSLYDIRNLRIEDGVFKVRGGWSTFSTGDSANEMSIFAYSDVSGSKLVSTNGTDFRHYDTDTSTWINLLESPTGSYNKTYFTTMPKSDGTTALIFGDGNQDIIKWDGSTKPLELSATLLHDMESEWEDNSSTEADAFEFQGTTVLRGSTCLQLNATDAETAAVRYSPGGAKQTFNEKGNQNRTVRIGDYDGTEQQTASKVELDGNTFDTVKFQYRPEGSPTSSNFFIRFESDDGGVPSGNLIASDAHGVLVGSETSDTYHTGVITLAGTQSYTGTAWCVFGVCTNGSVADPFTWDDNTTDMRFELGYKSGMGIRAYREHATDPQTQSWTSDVSAPWVELSYAGTGVIAWGGAGFDAQDDDELWITLRCSDTSLIDITNVTDGSFIGFNDSNPYYARALLDISTISDDTWTTLKIKKSDFTEENIAFDWTDIQTVDLTFNIAGNDSSAVEIDLFIDQMRFVPTLVSADAISNGGSNTRGPNGYYLSATPHGDRLLIARTISSIDNTGDGYMWYSDPYDFDSFSSNKFVSFSRPITGLGVTNKFVFVFAREKRWILSYNYAASDYTSAALDWQITLGDGPGTVSHRSISRGTMKNVSGLFYLATTGVYFTNGVESVKVSGKVDVLFKEKFSSNADWYNNSIDKGNWENAVGKYHEGNYYLSYQPVMQDDGTAAADNELTLVLNTETGEWVKDIPTASVFVRSMTTWQDDSGIPQLLGAADNGEVYKIIPSRATLTDDGSAYTHYFQTPYIGLATLNDLNWRTLFLWVRSDEADALDLRIAMYELDPDETNFNNWDESLTTAKITAQKAYTPTAFAWHRLRIPLEDMTTSDTFLTSRAVSFRIYDNNNEPIDIIPEMVVCEPGNDELDE